MAITNHERVGKALTELRAGIFPFVEREFQSRYGERSLGEAQRFLGPESREASKPFAEWDAHLLLKLMWEAWNAVFRDTLGRAERSIVSELRDARNRWAHQRTFSSDDAYRALDSATRLLTAVSAPQAADVEKLKIELLRVRFDAEERTARRKTQSSNIESDAVAGIPPWREVVAPHQDVAGGRYMQAEFAADLWQVHVGEGTREYRDPEEFFRRTYLTESLGRLLETAVRRLAGDSGDPVVQLQTNFGGGKTHSMLALYHLFSGVTPSELLGVEAVMAKAEIETLPKVKRVVLVGNKISPGRPERKDADTLVHTLWGEIAWQLGGREAYDKIREDDERATNPGDKLRSLMNEYGPCLILVDEWVAYARQLHDASDLPGGSFETHFTFAQALTESAKLASHCLLVISLPASDMSGSPHTYADDVEVGGERGREALNRLRNVVGRVESSWRPASAEEGFEIVRRRLFEPIVEKSQFVARDQVARKFYELYRSQKAEFPPECSEADYEKRIKAAYPIHPEVFDRLYTDWSTLVKFQRTRGVLRLMASVIHSLWEKGDRNPLIMPAQIPIDDQRVQFELTRYLSDTWVPVINKDVDGPESLPLRLDGDLPNLGRYAACRRVARTIYLGSAPTATAANRGIEDRRIKLGCVMPGESPAVFGDALRRLSQAATYLYPDGARFWYSTSPTVTKMAEDRAEQLRRDPDAVAREVEGRVRADLRNSGDFAKIHAFPGSSQDVPDDLDSRLVVLGIQSSYTKDPNSQAESAAREIQARRGNAPRLFQNTLVFLAVDHTRLQDLDEAVRKYLAWESIVEESDTLDLTAQQKRQAELQKDGADATVKARLPEAYQWLLVPTQASPQSDVEWQAFRLSGQASLAERASRKLKQDELMLTRYAGTVLRMQLDRIPLWRGNHVSVRQLFEDFARYPYLPKLKNTQVLASAILDGLNQISWEQDTFAYADSYDDEAGRYRGIKTAQAVMVSPEDASGLLIKSPVARAQMQAEAKSEKEKEVDAKGDGKVVPAKEDASLPTKERKTVRFFGAVELDATRVGRDASRIADEVIAHLAGLPSGNVTVTIEIEAEVESGIPDNVKRIVGENARTLKFREQGFEEQ